MRSREFDKQIIDFMKQKQVSKMPDIIANINVSPSTVKRALKKVGYVTSCNEQSSFYSLNQNLNFDDNGIAYHKKIMFCKSGSLKKEILNKTNNSIAGFSSNEIIGIYGENCRNVLCQLHVKGEVVSKYLTGVRYYFSKEENARSEQTVERIKLIDAEHAENERLKQDTILFVMGQCLKNTSISPKGIQNRLKKIGVFVSLSDVEQVMEVYELKNIIKKN